MRLFAFILLSFSIKPFYAQNGLIQDLNFQTNRCYSAVWITGKIYDAVTKESLGNATIGIRGTKLYCLADSAGQYALNIMSIADTVKTFGLIGTYISYQPKVVTIKEKIVGNINIDLALIPGGTITCFPDPPPLTKKQIRKLKKQRKGLKNNE